jgi:hypothetical protein
MKAQIQADIKMRCRNNPSDEQNTLQLSSIKKMLKDNHT